ncbi:MAG: cache domain-containing protein, partial [Cyanobacteria bacterium J06626_18]
MASFKQIPWYNSLQFQGILVFASIVGWLTLAIALAMHTLGKQVVSSQAEISLEQLGNNAVTGLSGRLQEIASLTRAIATTARELPADEVLFQQTIPDLLHFDGDLDVAGGGVWPEPFQFDPSRERASFFWGRDAMGRLTYYDGYNLPGPGYHNEAWYVTAQHIEPGTCSWSESYMDPYSLEPMVTCTVGIFQASNLKGAATVDLNLRGLKQWASEWQDSMGGYLFVVDRNNRFITFPKSDWVRHINVDSEGNQTENYLLVENLAAINQDFAPINEALNTVNKTLLAEAE